MSLRNSNVSNKCKIFEKCIECILRYNKYNYLSQVSLNLSVRTFQLGKKQPVIDFVVAPHGVNIIGSNVSDCVVISCKYTCRERYKQDENIKQLQPLCYILLVGTDDYPSCFIDNERNKLFTVQPKQNDKNKRLTFDDFTNELNKFVKPIYNTQHEIKYIDLCCGIGSFHYSANKFNNMKCVMVCDIDRYAKQFYKTNYENTELLNDVNDIDFNKYEADVVFSGNPCQSFSQIGKRQGLNDERGNLFETIINNVVCLHKYKIIVFENVYGLLTHDNGETFNFIKTSIEQHGYKVNHIVLLCSYYGIPQNRKRVFIICYQPNIITYDIDIIINNVLNKYKQHISLTDYLKHDFVFERDTAYTIRCGGCLSPIDSKQNWDGYYIVDTQGNRQEYRLTINDMITLQGFDTNVVSFDNIPLTQQKKLLGNTIPTNLTKIIIEIVNEMLITNNDNKQ